MSSLHADGMLLRKCSKVLKEPSCGNSVTHIASVTSTSSVTSTASVTNKASVTRCGASVTSIASVTSTSSVTRCGASVTSIVRLLVDKTCLNTHCDLITALQTDWLDNTEVDQ